MKNLLKNLKKNLLNTTEKAVMDNLKNCDYHDQRLYPHVLADEYVPEMNRKVCYICSSKLVMDGKNVECMFRCDKAEGVGIPLINTRSVSKQ